MYLFRVIALSGLQTPCGTLSVFSLDHFGSDFRALEHLWKPGWVSCDLTVIYRWTTNRLMSLRGIHLLCASGRCSEIYLQPACSSFHSPHVLLIVLEFPFFPFYCLKLNLLEMMWLLLLLPVFSVDLTYTASAAPCRPQTARIRKRSGLARLLLL